VLAIGTSTIHSQPGKYRGKELVSIEIYAPNSDDCQAQSEGCIGFGRPLNVSTSMCGVSRSRPRSWAYLRNSVVPDWLRPAAEGE
jgi:hypothetical protein